MVRDTRPGTLPTADNFDKLYRGQPSFEGGPKPIGIPWDIHQTQPQLMELEALGGIADQIAMTLFEFGEYPPSWGW